MTLSYNTSVKRRGFNKIKSRSLNSKFKPYNILCPNQTCKDFIQASKIPSKLLFKHCSCYSDTRGVTGRPAKEGGRAASPCDQSPSTISQSGGGCGKGESSGGEKGERVR
jgi:hypothetical protein